MAWEASLRMDYVRLADGTSARRDALLGDDLLGAATFAGAPLAQSSNERLAARSEEIPLADVRAPVLDPSNPVLEVWRTDEPTSSGHHGRIHYRRSEGMLFGTLSVAEPAPRTASGVARANRASVVGSDISVGSAHLSSPSAEPSIASSGDSTLQRITELAYREVFSALDSLGYRHLLRIWNYLPEINVHTLGIERYRQFNSGRRKALLASGRNVTGNVPAACALGSEMGSPLLIYFIASQAMAPTPIENPRQISAYEYPQQYGPKPAFSRANVLHQRTGSTLFISGTASIVGHETRHVGDISAQTLETVANIEALLAETHRVTGGPRFGLDDLAYKVYVRKPAHLPTIQSHLRAALGPRAQILYLRADICREELLVEIEAVGQVPAGA